MRALLARRGAQVLEDQARQLVDCCELGQVARVRASGSEDEPGLLADAFGDVSAVLREFFLWFGKDDDVVVGCDYILTFRT